ncbi:DNA replication/repair protein RecF [Candidatus Babela massiliensis]|uniref:DNA replication and repair protein RecF n=1 Tax=Candidatus Babela massiliensis TaxID=673862 RepID=V6DEZ7_9BACT|nr:DNA replication and repair protein RecF [Candidatus Babela massiliensis]CDK30172.1 Recombinational DNA repair ATPase RecF [Candidatus Babela massiliensis]
MKVTSLKLKNFRCFDSQTFTFGIENDIIFITGPNGSGKSSILEALHYSSYLRSFRTHLPVELALFDAEYFSIGTSISHVSSFIDNHTDTDNLQIVFTLNNLKRIVKLNQKPISSFKDIYNIFKVVTVTADDLKLIQDGPLLRRNFIDQTIMFNDSSYISLISKYKRVLENRNALLFSKFDKESYNLWSEKLFDLSKTIQKLRIQALENIGKQAKIIFDTINLSDNSREVSCNLDIKYQYAQPYSLIAHAQNFQEFIELYPSILQDELNRKKTLFGTHLDDFKIIFQDKYSRTFSSRGQQKMILMLLKLAQISLSNKNKDNAKNTILLIDDFFSDFDSEKFNAILSFIPTIASQTFVTSPGRSFIDNTLNNKNLSCQYIELDL